MVVGRIAVTERLDIGRQHMTAFQNIQASPEQDAIYSIWRLSFPPFYPYLGCLGHEVFQSFHCKLPDLYGDQNCENSRQGLAVAFEEKVSPSTLGESFGLAPPLLSISS